MSWISVRDAMDIAKICKRSIVTLCRTGQIECRKDCNGCWAIRKESVVQYAESHRRHVEEEFKRRTCPEAQETD